MTRTARFQLKKQIGQVKYYGPGRGMLVGMCISATKQIGLAETYQGIHNNPGSNGFPKLDRPNIKRNTALQQKNRLRFHQAMAAWGELSAEGKALWSLKGKPSGRKGLNCFLSVYLKSPLAIQCDQLLNHGFGIQPFGLSAFGSPGMVGFTSGFYSNRHGERFDGVAGFGQSLFGRRNFGTPYYAKGNFGCGCQQFGSSSFGQLVLAPWQYGAGWQYFGLSPFGSTLPGAYGGA